MRDNRRRLRYALDIWMKLIVDRGKLKDLEKWGLRSWMHSSMTQLGVIVKAWQECVAKAKHFKAIRRRFFDQGLSSSFYQWNDYVLQSRKERHVIRRCLHRIGFRELDIVFQQWHECVDALFPRLLLFVRQLDGNDTLYSGQLLPRQWSLVSSTVSAW